MPSSFGQLSSCFPLPPLHCTARRSETRAKRGIISRMRLTPSLGPHAWARTRSSESFMLSETVLFGLFYWRRGWIRTYVRRGLDLLANPAQGEARAPALLSLAWGVTMANVLCKFPKTSRSSERECGVISGTILLHSLAKGKVETEPSFKVLDSANADAAGCEVVPTGASR